MTADTGWVEYLARRFHEEYERLAPNFGYETRKESAVPWEAVPEANRLLMQATIAAVLEPAGWSAHRRPDGSLGRVHDKNSVHMDGCVPLFALTNPRSPDE